MSIGYYGKLPAKGDFLRYNCPAGFVDCWDKWVQNGMAASRAVLGKTWETAYDSAPLWRFCLGQGICGAAPVVGVLMPSQDRVGRRFPLTLIWPQPFDVTQEALKVEPFMTQMEDALLKVLTANDTVALLRQRLAQLQLPELPQGTTAGSCWFSTFYGGKPRQDWRHFDSLPSAGAFADLLTLAEGGGHV